MGGGGVSAASPGVSPKRSHIEITFSVRFLKERDLRCRPTSWSAMNSMLPLSLVCPVRGRDSRT